MMSSPPEGQRAARTNVLLAATLETSTGLAGPVRVANLSTSGALVFGDLLPAAAERVTLICAASRIAARVAWVGTQHAGLAFDQAINPSDVLPKRAATATLIVKDERELDFRRPGFRGN